MNTDALAEKTAEQLKQKLDPKPTPSSVREKNLNPSLNSTTDYQASILTPQLGRAKIGEDLKNVYRIARLDKAGNEQSESAWHLFSVLTSDIRISNLDPLKPEYEYVQWGLKMMWLCIQQGYFESAALVQGMISAVTEASLAKNGMFLTNLQTVRQESQHIQMEAPIKSRSIFGRIKNALGR